MKNVEIFDVPVKTNFDEKTTITCALFYFVIIHRGFVFVCMGCCRCFFILSGVSFLFVLFIGRL